MIALKAWYHRLLYRIAERKIALILALIKTLAPHEMYLLTDRLNQWADCIHQWKNPVPQGMHTPVRDYWQERWNADYWQPGNPIYEHYQKRK